MTSLARPTTQSITAELLLCKPTIVLILFIIIPSTPSEKPHALRKHCWKLTPKTKTYPNAKRNICDRNQNSVVWVLLCHMLDRRCFRMWVLRQVRMVRGRRESLIWVVSAWMLATLSCLGMVSSQPHTTREPSPWHHWLLALRHTSSPHSDTTKDTYPQHSAHKQ